MITGFELVAKVEKIKSKFAKHEAEVLKQLNKVCMNRCGIVTEPVVYFYGFYTLKNHFVILMQALGPSIRDLKKRIIADRFSKKTSLWVCRKMIQALEFVHSIGMVHGDVKPSNFCIGLNKRDRQVYIIDFGVTRKFNPKAEGFQCKLISFIYKNMS